jgi:lipopolysaccharide/colanic/teichoic acid biosynthesis glycosyltransferase
MIIRSRRKNESLLRRFFKGKTLPTKSEFLTSEQFHLELLKEMYRSDRRQANRDLAIVRLLVSNPQLDAMIESDAMSLVSGRLRISDSIGWYDSSLAVLLPETGKDDALVVANSITKIVEQEGFKVDTEVSIYPWDDDLVSLADELKSGFSNESDFDNDEDSGDPDRTQSSQPSANGSDSLKAVEASLQSSSVLMSRYDFVKSHKTPWWKRAVDVVFSGCGLIALSPVLIGAAVAIKLSSPGPIFFSQLREGKDGKQFGILKFRTMVIDAEELQTDLLEQSEQDGPAFKMTNDPRVTKVGKYLRKSCVDELPQLYNVLIGEMSLVGPRPLPVHESLGCKAWQRARLTVLPGLTCIWQARGGRDVKFAEWMRMDLHYIEKRSFWFDMKLIIETAFIALLHRGSV